MGKEWEEERKCQRPKKKDEDAESKRHKSLSFFLPSGDGSLGKSIGCNVDYINAEQHMWKMVSEMISG